MSIRDLIDAIESGNSLEIMNVFEEIVTQKIKSRLDERKKEIAKDMFEAADRAFGVPQEPNKYGVDPADSKSASLKVTKKKTSNPEIVVNEVLDPEDPASEWIHDFVHSDNPKFAGKSKEERKQMALAAWYAAKRKK